MRAREIGRPTSLTRPFWEGVDAGRLLLQRDPGSGRFQFYPKPLASFDAAAQLEWAEVSGLGAVAAVTTVHSAPPEFADAVPYTVALVRLDEGAGIVAPVIGTGSSGARIGDRVRFVGRGAAGVFPFGFALDRTKARQE